MNTVVNTPFYSHADFLACVEHMENFLLSSETIFNKYVNNFACAALSSTHDCTPQDIYLVKTQLQNTFQAYLQSIMRQLKKIQLNFKVADASNWLTPLGDFHLAYLHHGSLAVENQLHTVGLRIYEKRKEKGGYFRECFQRMVYLLRGRITHRDFEDDYSVLEHIIEHIAEHGSKPE